MIVTSVGGQRSSPSQSHELSSHRPEPGLPDIPRTFELRRSPHRLEIIRIDIDLVTAWHGATGLLTDLVWLNKCLVTQVILLANECFEGFKPVCGHLAVFNLDLEVLLEVIYVTLEY